ncbi:helix-turn-helix domain-containing protein [Microbacterium sp. HD4P20]|uniref:helix-turn-helix domain-containing protein n=1 Tax=Microbacterium sp. HD4P20 TaxID=2864874 RepID=UPI0020A43D6A|nr:helix-turn-helix domain-containing protein [Microbacterium sp. HD4P20]MCP2636891.1 helix-turn-helix domain-containing protein [Microbacterium sp. HD4P20]
MPIESEDREADSPYVARVWRGRTSGAGVMNSVSTSTWELVFWQDGGVIRAAARGPETRPTEVRIDGESESIGITFSHGTTMPHLPSRRLIDSDAESPHVDGRRFVLRGEEWEIPGFDDAEHFVQKLVRAGVLTRDPLVDDVVWGGMARVGTRSVQRRVAAATGLTAGAIRQIERARQAAVLLGEGLPIARVVHELGFYDQPHLARSLQRFIGRSATELRQPGAGDALSLLYRTDMDHPS